MKKEYPLEKMDLALFENNKQSEEYSQLKDFLSFLKLNGYPMPYRFSHVESSGPLIENLTLNENLLLHANSNHVENEKNRVIQVIEQSGNHHLMKLYHEVTLKDSKPGEVDDETRKAIALIKALIHEGDFLFLENPEKFLGKKLLNLFIQALVYKTATKGLMVVISTRFKSLWAPHLTKEISRDENNYFRVSHYNAGLSNSLMKMQKSEKSQSEGVLKIVNTNTVTDEENKKAA